MRKQLLFILFIVAVNTNIASPTITEVRKWYFQASTNNTVVDKIIQSISDNDAKSDFRLRAYKGAAITMTADQSYNPFEKLKRFNEGKSLIESAIKEKQSDTELRFIRFTVQAECPSFLGYSSELESDKKLILNNWSSFREKTNDSYYINQVKKYLLQSKHLTEAEKKSLQ